MESARFACAFTGPRACSHDAIFKDAYERSNRMNRTKIVRCFPHCCPSHKSRSYCGTSLLLTVRSSSAIETPLQVFARFRPAKANAMRAGELVPVHFIVSSLQSEQNTTAEWVGSRTLETNSESGPVVFEINPTARWVYAWDSGATKAQRSTKHLLEAVVVSPCRRNGDVVFQVVATTQSSAFTFASFRRAAEGDARDSQQSLLYQALAWEMERRNSGSSTTTATYDGVPVMPWLPRETQRIETEKPVHTVQAPAHAHAIDERLFTENLALLFSVVDQLPAGRLANQLSNWEFSIHTRVLDPTRIDASNDQHQPVDCLEMATQLVCWLQNDPKVATEVATFAARAIDTIFDTRAMLQLYERWMERLEKRISSFLNGFRWTLADLVRDLNQDFSEGPSTDFRHGFDWLSFIARVQHAAVDRFRGSRNFRMSQPDRQRSAVWVCRSRDVQVLIRENRVALVEVATTGLFLAFVNQLSPIYVDIQSRSLHIESALSTTGQSPAGLNLVLDGKERQFTTLPNGDSALGASVSSSHTIGDYFGFTFAAESKTSAEVTCFAWPRNYGDKAYRWRWIVLTKPKGLYMSIHIDVGHVKSHDDPLDTLRVHEKMALVLRWVPQCRAVLPFRRMQLAVDTARVVL